MKGRWKRRGEKKGACSPRVQIKDRVCGLPHGRYEMRCIWPSTLGLATRQFKPTNLSKHGKSILGAESIHFKTCALTGRVMIQMFNPPEGLLLAVLGATWELLTKKLYRRTYINGNYARAFSTNNISEDTKVRAWRSSSASLSAFPSSRVMFGCIRVQSPPLCPELLVLTSLSLVMEVPLLCWRP